MRAAMQVHAPVLGCLHDGHQLALGGRVVDLSWLQLLAPVRHRPHHAVTVLLAQHRTDRKAGRVRLHDPLQLRVGMGQQRRVCQRSPQSIKRGLLLSAPHPRFAVRCLRQIGQRLRYAREARHEATIEASQAQEGTHVLH